MNLCCFRGLVLGSGTSHDSGNLFFAMCIFILSVILKSFSLGLCTVLWSTGLLVVDACGLLVVLGGVLRALGFEVVLELSGWLELLVGLGGLLLVVGLEVLTELSGWLELLVGLGGVLLVVGLEVSTELSGWLELLVGLGGVLLVVGLEVLTELSGWLELSLCFSGNFCFLFLR